MDTTKLPDKGKKLRDFSLKDQRGQEFLLSNKKGKKVLLSFHPLAWTPVCAAQMQSLEKTKKTFDRLNTIAVGISVDSVPCKAAWAKALKVKNTALLSDFWPHGKLAGTLGILRSEGFSERANILLDESGRVLNTKIYPIRQVPNIEEIIQWLKK